MADVAGAVLRIGVVGGSVAGCAMAIAGARAGAEVTVYERSDGALEDRGFGIVIPPALHQELVAAGYLEPGMPTAPVPSRVWLTREHGRPAARELARQESAVTPCHWGLLWRTLRANTGAVRYHRGRPVTEVLRRSAGGAVIRTADAEDVYDIVVGADGPRSVTREALAPGVRPAQAGYAVWRGTLPLAALAGHPRPLELLRGAWITLGFRGGHGVFYLIPGAAPGSRLLAYAVYGPPPPASWAAGREAYVRHIAEEHFPADWADIVGRGEHTSMAYHPVTDFHAPLAADPPFLLAGDAASITRPHTASGATKALQDALCLERVLRGASSPADALRRYAAERTPEGARLVALGRRLGHAMVERTPDWAAMGAAEVETWCRATLDGADSYLYGAAQGFRARPAGGLEGAGRAPTGKPVDGGAGAA
ncbi:FAD-dependent monooxygenase [Streptomyces sp. RKAG290]|uniref:FAD-dependent monooxygenase n=1 Tax=Streptomyces sp. RKAG290 TaxID=2888348 RepID=UPI0020339A88|nr:FAD-dependent monooxygenase [Streptomyces sp. RKAG290]MCM2410942.1 FAD-dependent monooxygenase [Streptomyces sp. RKAG290]